MADKPYTQQQKQWIAEIMEETIVYERLALGFFARQWGECCADEPEGEGESMSTGGAK